MELHARLAYMLAVKRGPNFIFALIFMAVLLFFTWYEYEVKDSFREQSRIEQLILQSRSVNFANGNGKIIFYVEGKKKRGEQFDYNDIKLLNEYYADYNQYLLENPK